MDVSNHIDHARQQSRYSATRTDRDIIPPVQLEPTGNPISISDETGRTGLFAVVFSLTGWVIGRDLGEL